MPDWFYHPIYKPIVTNLLPAESARRLTLFAMQLQSRFWIGRKIFDLLSRTQLPVVIPESVRTEVFGLQFPTPIGLAHGIDIEGQALPLWSMLGCGFVQVGVLDIANQLDSETYLLPEFQGIITNRDASASNIEAIAHKIHNLSEEILPIGVALSASHIVETIGSIEQEADFFSIPCDVAHNRTYLSEIRSSTEKPLLLRLTLLSDKNIMRQAIKNAVQAGFDGCILLDGESTNLMEDGVIYGAHLHEKTLEWIRYIVDVYGEQFPVIAGGGILSPQDAIDCLSAGAKLVQLYEGLIYSGPGLPRRIIKQILKSEPEIKENPSSTHSIDAENFGWQGIACVGIVQILAGIAGIIGAILFTLLPYELHYIQMTVAELNNYFDGRLAGFIFHDRISYHGALISFGILFIWLAWYPLREKHQAAWAWWALFISGTIGACSTFISYIFSDYFDPWYSSASIILIAIFYTGLILTYRTMENPPQLSSLFQAGRRIWAWSPAGIGRSYLMFWAATTALGGLLIFYTGMTQVFVQEDFAYMRTTLTEIEQISPRVIPFVAHDRIAFGVNLFAIGVAALAIVWKGIPEKSALIALSLTYLVANLTAIWVHPIVGYNSFSHLLPFLVKDSAFVFAMFHLNRPMRIVKKRGSTMTPSETFNL